jgi:hypothetical protein
VRDPLKGWTRKHTTLTDPFSLQDPLVAVIQAVALGALAGRHALPRPGQDRCEQLVDPVAGAAEPDRVVAGDRQHIAERAGLRLGPQPGAVALDLIAGHPGGRHPASSAWASIRAASSEGGRPGDAGQAPVPVGWWASSGHSCSNYFPRRNGRA